MSKKVFKIDNLFYPEQITLQCCNTFQESFDVSYNNGELTIQSDEDNHDVIFWEFMNYQIYLQLH